MCVAAKIMHRGVHRKRESAWTCRVAPHPLPISSASVRLYPFAVPGWLLRTSHVFAGDASLCCCCALSGWAWSPRPPVACVPLPVRTCQASCGEVVSASTICTGARRTRAGARTPGAAGHSVSRDSAQAEQGQLMRAHPVCCFFGHRLARGVSGLVLVRRGRHGRAPSALARPSASARLAKGAR